MMKKNIIAGQSGGPTAVINASLYGIIKEGLRRHEQVDTVYGMINGIEGFLDGRFMDLSRDLSDAELERLKLTPAAYLGSCRYKLPEDLQSDVYKTLFSKFDQLNIGCFFYIGGNDSMDTVSKLSRYAKKIDSEIRFIGIPKTIDNDLIHTDHTPGYGSAAKYVASTVREIALDASVYEQKSVTIVEVMGRHAGWLTAASALARKFKEDNPLLIYLPERPFEFDQFSAALKSAFDKTHNVVVCVSEGIADSKGRFICEAGGQAQTDTFGHKMLAGCGKVLEHYVRSEFKVKARSVELNVSQRCSGMLISKTDLDEAVIAGAFGTASALKGETGCMTAFKRDEESPYRVSCHLKDVDLICNQEKTFPSDWIINQGADVSEAFFSYALPLIQGEAVRPMESGLPLYLFRR